jgi:hypothetical protein
MRCTASGRLSVTVLPCWLRNPKVPSSVSCTALYTVTHNCPPPPKKHPSIQNLFRKTANLFNTTTALLAVVVNHTVAACPLAGTSAVVARPQAASTDGQLQLANDPSVTKPSYRTNITATAAAASTFTSSCQPQSLACPCVCVHWSLSAGHGLADPAECKHTKGSAHRHASHAVKPDGRKSYSQHTGIIGRRLEHL